MNRPATAIFGILLLASAPALLAQGINPRNPPPPPPAPAATPPAAPAQPSTPDSADKSAAAKASGDKPIDPSVPPPPPPADEPETPAEPAGPTFDPLHAQRSIDIGTFYLRKGVYDAAIDRFIEASNYQPSLSAPWKLLGEAYEKKHENAKAIEAYNKYLQIVPHAADAAKIQKLVTDLQEKIPESSKK